jgi:hypothetical protein
MVIRVHGDAVWTAKCSEYVSSLDERRVRDYVDKFMLVYLDDVLIFSRSTEEDKGACGVRLEAFAGREAVCEIVEV